MAGALTKRNGRGLSLTPLEMFPQLRTIENMMSRMFDDSEEGWLGGTLSPMVDVSETENAIDVQVDLPGMKAEEIDIQVHNNQLTIKGERQEEKEEKGRTFHRIERRSGTFARVITLPAEVDENKVDAQYKDGVLKITLPRTTDVKAKKICVKA